MRKPIKFNDIFTERNIRLKQTEAIKKQYFDGQMSAWNSFYRTKDIDAYRENLKQVERDYQRGLVLSKPFYDNHLQQVLSCAQNNYERGVYDAKEIYDKTKRDAEQEMYRQLDMPQIKAQKALTANDHKRSLVNRETSIISYEMIAKLIGLDGICDDIHSYVSLNITCSDVQPLLTYEDLGYALKDEGPDSLLTKSFLEVMPDDERTDTTAIRQAVNSLDLSSGLSIFKHQCQFNNTPTVLHPNTLYVDIADDVMSCTVLSPVGDKRLTSQFKIMQQDVGLMDRYEQIEKDSAFLIRNMYDQNSYYEFHALASLLNSVNGLEDHALKTVVLYNRQLALNNQLNPFILTKKHLHLKHEKNIFKFKTTPLYQLRQEHEQTRVTISNEYNKERELQEAVYRAKIAQAEQLLDETYEFLTQQYEKVLDEHKSAMEDCYIQALLLAEKNFLNECAGIDKYIRHTAQEYTPKPEVKSTFFQPPDASGGLPVIDEMVEYYSMDT